MQGVPSKLLQQLHRFQLFTLPQMAIPKQFPLVGGLSGCQLEVHGVSAKRDCLSTKKKDERSVLQNHMDLILFQIKLVLDLFYI